MLFVCLKGLLVKSIKLALIKVIFDVYFNRKDQEFSVCHKKI